MLNVYFQDIANIITCKNCRKVNIVKNQNLTCGIEQNPIIKKIFFSQNALKIRLFYGVSNSHKRLFLLLMCH
jgi:hypothetical protein